MTAALVTPEIRMTVENFKRYEYAEVERGLSRLHTVTFYLVNFDTAVCDHHGLAEQLRQHNTRWQGVW